MLNIINKTKMKLIKVNTPLQHDTTLDKQCINGEYPNWCVMTERAKLNETFDEWWNRKKDYMKSNPKYKDVEGIYLYDIQPIGDIVGNPKAAGLFIRYDYIKTKQR